MQLAGTAVYTLLFLFYLRRAYQDHAALPWARYRLSNLYIRLLVSLHCEPYLLATWGLATLATALGALPPAKPLSPPAGKLVVLQDSCPAVQCFSTSLSPRLSPAVSGAQFICLIPLATAFAVSSLTTQPIRLVPLPTGPARHRGFRCGAPVGHCHCIREPHELLELP